MRRSKILKLATLLAVCAAVFLVPCAPARAGVPELMERAVLPATQDLPTCACAVPLRDGDQLVVGLANGEIVSFHETAGSVIPRIISLPGSGPIDAVIACRVGRAAGSANEFALLAVRGAELFSIGFSDMTVAGRVALPSPSGRYRFAKATRDRRAVPGAYVTGGVDHPVLFDNDSAMRINVETRTLLPRVEPVIDGVPGLAVTALSDRETVVAGPRIIECAGAGGVNTQIDERTDLADETARVVVGRVLDEARTLELRVMDPDSVWVSRTVTAPGRISVVTSIADSVVAMGGTVPLTPSHDVGWVALVDPKGKVFAMSDHASPVTNITRVSNFIAVQGDGRNLSVYDMALRPLWDHDSPVTGVVLLSGDFAGGEAVDLAVVGTRTYRVGTADADSVRRCLDMPDFMAGAAPTDGGYELERSFITFYVSNEEKLRKTLADGSRAAADAFASGEVDEAIEHATTARAAAAVLGDRGNLIELSSRLRDFVLFANRRRSLLLAAFVLAALGMWVAVECARRTAGLVVSGAGAILLLVSGAWAWKLIGNTGLNPSLFAGGALAAFAVVRAQVAAKPPRPVAGSAIEDLIRALMEFLHGAGEGVPSDGVVDAARKSVTKVAYLSQEMVDSLDDEERYAMLRGRLRSRGDDFTDTTYPRVAVVLSLAKSAGFIVHEAGQMSRAAERMRTAIAAILSGATPKPPVLKQQLLAIKEGRDQLATAADRAWALVQANPGCSLTRSIDRILGEKREDLAEAGVRVKRTRGVPPERDAIALWSFEFRFILENLVTNAVRAMRSSKERVFTIETATDGKMCSVRISDTGAGVDETTARRIFEAKDDERDGGFGMPNSRLRLQEHGGDLTIERTAPGEGMTFLLTIPHWIPNTGESDV
ncbi:MAG: ATP-binding protein [Candidatus Eisenbacteria bacterium]